VGSLGTPRTFLLQSKSPKSCIFKQTIDNEHSFNLYPCSPAELQAWLQRVGDWETIVKPDLINLVEAYRDRGINEVAIFGMCWGGKVATLAATELRDYFKASAIVHPASVANSEADGVEIPMFLMPTANEPDMVSFSYNNYNYNPPGHIEFTLVLSSVIF